jgi:hypothetical protein
VDAFLEGLLSAAILTPGDTDVQDVVDDPTDNKYLACALEGRAEHISLATNTCCGLTRGVESALSRPLSS